MTNTSTTNSPFTTAETTTTTDISHNATYNSPSTSPNPNITHMITWVPIGVVCLLVITVALVCTMKRKKNQVNKKFSVLYKRYFGFSLRNAFKSNAPLAVRDDNVSGEIMGDTTCMYVNESANKNESFADAPGMGNTTCRTCAYVNEAVISNESFCDALGISSESLQSSPNQKKEHIYSVCDSDALGAKNFGEFKRIIARPTVSETASGTWEENPSSDYVSLYDYNWSKFSPHVAKARLPTSYLCSTPSYVNLNKMQQIEANNNKIVDAVLKNGAKNKGNKLCDKNPRIHRPADMVETSANSSIKKHLVHQNRNLSTVCLKTPGNTKHKNNKNGFKKCQTSNKVDTSKLYETESYYANVNGGCDILESNMSAFVNKPLKLCQWQLNLEAIHEDYVNSSSLAY